MRRNPAREGVGAISKIVGSRRLSRRSFLARVTGGGIAFGAAALVSGCKDPEGEAGGGALTDCDSGKTADPAGQGRSGGRTGVSDNDGGPSADPAGCGSGDGPVTDSDRGRLSDPAGEGRGTSNITDRDTGFSADPIGRGRSTAPQSKRA